MKCEKVLDKIYEDFGKNPKDSMSLITRIRVGLHLLVCPDCTQAVERFEVCKDILHSESLSPSASMEDTVMAMIAAEEEETKAAEISGGFSVRGWIIAGLVMLVSLVTVFFSMDFNTVALAAGTSFLIPIGITIGIVLTCYGALFIGSHLKEFTERFDL
jgi:hypothetical protein